ncbi:MAG TPA: hydrogen gas-evolving membrane-bound hydrogenase subunit E [Clostridia bacterium]|nr:hydrogen gas-evolving membrane-bound hydrogenase subunit E [Clostridia bacterium]
MRKVLSVALAIALIAILLFGVADLPTFGNAENPSNNEVSYRYLEKGVEETGAVNVVAGIILDYRAFDTFGEATVLFTALITVIAVLRRDEDE